LRKAERKMGHPRVPLVIATSGTAAALAEASVALEAGGKKGIKGIKGIKGGIKAAAKKASAKKSSGVLTAKTPECGGWPTAC
jgi:type IV pilus biogenesis protein CpaD/CtpE